MFMLRMPNERKMSVENEGDVADIADCGMRIAERNTNEASYPQPAITNRQLSERAAKVLEAVQTFFNYVQASGVTQRMVRSSPNAAPGTTATFALLSKRSAKFCEVSPNWLMFTST